MQPCTLTPERCNPEGPPADFEIAATLQHPKRDRFWPGADRAYLATVRRRRKRGAQQKKREEKERGAYEQGERAGPP